MRIWVSRHGFPAVLLGDNGTQFMSESVQSMYRTTGVNKVYSSPYHPQGNSVVESYMRTMKKGLAALTSGSGAHWDQRLQAVLFTYNTTPHTARFRRTTSSTGASDPVVTS